MFTAGHSTTSTSWSSSSTPVFSAGSSFSRGASSTSAFQRLKPNCVELLGLASVANYKKEQVERTVSCLRKLRSTLRAIISEGSASNDSPEESATIFKAEYTPILPASLINYIFFPISQLISSVPQGVSSLPDSISEQIFEILTLLGTDWWHVWAYEPPIEHGKALGVWRDLLILAVSVLATPQSAKPTTLSASTTFSDETKVAAVRFSEQLLRPRFQCGVDVKTDPQISNETTSQEWEWDGVSDLPSLDELERETKPFKHVPPAKDSQNPKVIYPSAHHLDFVMTDRTSKGAISFTLSSMFSLAEDSTLPSEVRKGALKVANHSLLLWIGGTCCFSVDRTSRGRHSSEYEPGSQLFVTSHRPIPSRPELAKTTASRLRPILPGVTSSLTRLITSKVKSKPNLSAAGKTTPGEVAAAALKMLSELLLATIADDTLSDVLQSSVEFEEVPPTPKAASREPVTSLNDFANLDLDDEEAPVEMLERADEHESQRSNNHETADSDSPLQSQHRWALSTLSQIKLALKTFGPLTSASVPGTSLPSSIHTSLQKGLVDLAGGLIFSCGAGFQWLDSQLRSLSQISTTDKAEDIPTIEMLLTWILDLSSDINTTSVASHARSLLNKLWVAQQEIFSPDEVVRSMAQRGFSQLPDAILTHNDEKVSRISLRLIALFSTVSETSQRNLISSSDLIGSTQSIQQWGSQLARSLRVTSMEWAQSEIEEDRQLRSTFSDLESSSAEQLLRMFFALGKASAKSALGELQWSDHEKKETKPSVFQTIIYFIEQAAALRSVRILDGAESARQQSLACLVVASEMLRGASLCLANLELGFSAGGAGKAKKARKMSHKLAKRVFVLIIEMLEGDAEEALHDLTVNNSASNVEGKQVSHRSKGAISRLSDADEEGDQFITEKVSGLSLLPTSTCVDRPQQFGPALDLSFVAAASMISSRGTIADERMSRVQQYRSAEHTIECANAVLFSLLSSTSRMLGPSFRPLLLQSSYPLMGGMASSSELMRSASASTLQDIAFHAAYADLKNCMLDQADYIVGAACQRLISGLDQELQSYASSISAKTTRSEHFEGTMVLPLTSAQRAPFVLVEMIRILGSEIIPMVEDAIDEILDALDRFHGHISICDGLLAVLDSILETMAMEQISKNAPGVQSAISITPWSDHRVQRTEVEDLRTWLQVRKGEFPAFDDPTPVDDSQQQSRPSSSTKNEDKPTKSQQVASQILSKSFPFLMHSSPMLRSRVLGLLRHGIETLAPQKRDAELLPLVNTVWPYVTTRLGPNYSKTNATSRGLDTIIDLQPSSRNQTDQSSKERRSWDEMKRIEASFVEQDPNVWISACTFIETAARFVADFVGKRIMDDAWPRFELLLKMVRWRFDPHWQYARLPPSKAAPPSTTAAAAQLAPNFLTASQSETPEPLREIFQTTDLESSAQPKRDPSAKGRNVHGNNDHPFIIQSTTSQPAQLTLSIVTTMTHVVEHLHHSIPEEIAWTIATNETFLSLLDSRQPLRLQSATQALYVQLGKRNGDATCFALQASFSETAQRLEHESYDDSVGTPCFLHRPNIQVHPETLHSILSQF